LSISFPFKVLKYGKDPWLEKGLANGRYRDFVLGSMAFPILHFDVGLRHFGLPEPLMIGWIMDESLQALTLNFVQ
jgi:hypothetical protein